MIQIDEKGDDSVIRELVEAEEKAALARFRSSHFQERMEQRIRSSALRPRRRFVSFIIPRPVWVALAGLLLVGGALLIYRFFAAPEPTASVIVENCLRQLHGLQALEKEPRPASDLSLLPASSLKKGIAAVLSSLDTWSATAPIPRRGSGFSVINPKTEPMDLKELYGILIMNQSVERVLTAIAQKTKEG